jgi:hypothetical protein
VKKIGTSKKPRKRAHSIPLKELRKRANSIPLKELRKSIVGFAKEIKKTAYNIINK